MKLINNSKLNLSHDKYYLGIGQILDVSDDVAKKWLNIEGISQYYTQDDIEKEKQKAVKEALKAEKRVLSKPKTTTKKKDK